MAIATPPNVTLPQSTQSYPEIRDALPEDREAAWRLQRAAFALPEDGPPAHPGSTEALRVYARDGQVVSCLTLIHATLCMYGADLPMGGVRHVATAPDEQNRGYASALLRDTLRGLRRQGIVTSVLFPFSFRYYRKFGYELGGNHCHFWCRPSCIPTYAERAEVRQAGPGDCAAAARFYRDRAGRSACSMARDERRWAALCSDPQVRVLVQGTGDLGGYAITTETRDTYGGRVLKVLDMAAGSPSSWRALLGALSQFSGESVEWLASATDLADSGLLRSPAPLREGYKPRGIATVRPMFQFRVVDVEEAIRARGGTFPEGRYRLPLRVRDELIPENNHPLAICGSGRRAEVRPARPDEACLEMDIQVFSQVFCGYMSASEAVSQGLAQGPEAAVETADRLFAPGEPFLSELDRF